MPLRSLGIIVALLLVATWLILRADSEELVREAHAQLAEVISKADNESGAAAILNARALQNLFADGIEISGDAQGLVGGHAPEELAGTIIRLRSVFQSVGLDFGELSITFPSDTEAITEFSAVLTADSDVEQIEPVKESRQVTAQLREIDGEWLFFNFELLQ